MISDPRDVKECLTRVLALMERRDEINEDIAKVLADYKGRGVVPKGIRRVAALQRMDAAKRRSDEEMYAEYEGALSVVAEAAQVIAAGGTYQDAQDKTGLSRATVARIAATTRRVSNEKDFETVAEVSNQEDFETAHDPDTGEITESSGQPGLPARTADTGPEALSSPLDPETADAGPPGEGPGTAARTDSPAPVPAITDDEALDAMERSRLAMEETRRALRAARA